MPIPSALQLPPHLKRMFEAAPSVEFAVDIASLQDAAGRTDPGQAVHTVSYSLPDGSARDEAWVARVKNGICANYFDPYLRRRDPDCMFIGDDGPTDKARYADRFGADFSALRGEALAWLQTQPLAAFCFRAGQAEEGIPSLAVVPANAAFFGLGLALLQGVVDPDAESARTGKPFAPACFLFAAPPFRHTHFGGRQVVVHNRLPGAYEILSFNLYPGPSAKKGVYGALLHFGEQEGWLTAHASAVQVVTPYNNRVTIMHEGASGSGKSEMNEHVHREFDGSLLFGENTVSGEKRYFIMPRGCLLHPVADDMALCHPSQQKMTGKLVISDAENAWFIRVDHIKNYGTDPDIESRSIHPEGPLLFLNIDAQPGGTALLWEHIEDAPGKPCPNPRFIVPRKAMPDVVNRPVSVDVRSFGIRTPPCTRERPSYGILGLFHVLPPALAWLWRLVSPRGHDNPSIVDSGGMESEGVGSFWPFASGTRVALANILLRQVVDHPRVHYVLCPVRHVGAWRTGFMPQWIMREYIARRGGVRFTPSEIEPARCPLLGYALSRLVVEGQVFERGLLRVDLQTEVGPEAYDAGAAQLAAFFKRELEPYRTDRLHPLGRRIIEAFLEGANVAGYEALLESESILIED